ncbi:MAG TPA: LysR family transcriptional regulator [Sphingomonas sp.]|jgi:DNA-binding transcriptional LysR family regulator|uniref:LysR family transcriptional regulator n=1 Tax=Sphingomonas sp. TaxID=28214 RepID=UPI002ED877C4
MRFKGLDLNLLSVFDTLMRTRSVSRTAEAMNLSQPAISSALKRLRDYFEDEILVAYGKRMLPTAHAESLLPQVRDSLRAVESLIATSTRFDPQSSHRTFRLSCSDYIATALFVPLAQSLATLAPHVRIELLLNDETSHGQLEQGMIDLLVTPDGYIARDLPADHLLDEQHVVVGWRDNPLFATELDEDAFLGASHIQVAIGAQRTLVFGDREMNRLGKRRQIDMIVSSFTIVPWLLVGTPRISLMHERLARMMAQHHPLAIAPIPFDFPVMREVIQCHPARAQDPGLIWLREQICKHASPIASIYPSSQTSG